MQPETILLPHFGLITGAEAQAFLEQSEQITVQTAQQILFLLEAGKTHTEILQCLTERFYLPHVMPVYPIDAFTLNTNIMIRLIESELYQK